MKHTFLLLDANRLTNGTIAQIGEDYGYKYVGIPWDNEEKYQEYLDMIVYMLRNGEKIADDC